MKIIPIISIIASLIFNVSCSSNTTRDDLKGEIIIGFADTLSQASVERFLHNHNLVYYSLKILDEKRSHIENVKLKAYVKVAITQEVAWRDTLLKCPEVKYVGVISSNKIVN
jgi:hypothetical protein